MNIQGSQTDDKPKSGGLRISRTTMPDDVRSTAAHPSNSEDNLLQVINRQSRELAMVITLEGKIKFCTQAIKMLLGYDSTRLIGNNVKEIIPVKQWVAFRAALRASEEESEEPIYIDCSFIDAEDKKQRFSVSVEDFRHHPTVEGYIVHAHMISRQKTLEKRLQLREAAMDAVKEAVIVIDPSQQKVLYANQAFYILSGFTATEIVGGKLDVFKSPYSEMLFDEKTDPKEIEKFRRALRRRTNYKGRIYSKRKNGEVFYNRFALKPTFDAQGDLQYYVATANKTRARKKK